MKSYFLLFLVFTFNFSFAQDLQRVRQTIKELAAPEMFGRGYTFEGNKKAANYIATKFKDFGLISYKHERKMPYYQHFSLDVNTFPQTPILVIGKDTLKAGADFIIQADSKSGKGNTILLEIDSLVFEQNEEAIAKFKAKNLENTIILYESRFEAKLYKLNPDVIRHWFDAVAFIKISSKLTMSLANKDDSPTTFEVKKSVIDKILALSKLGNQQEIIVSYELSNEVLRNYETQNVIAYQKGNSKNKSLADSMVVFSAHYDHLGSLGKDAIFYGANDNASGISMLLEMAAYYQQNPPPFTVVFMAFGAEEIGLLGSKYFVENPLFSLDKIKLLINLDLVGTGNEGLGVVNATVFPQQYAIFAKINTTNNYFTKIIKRGKAANSDHYFFTEKNVPSFFIYAMGGIQAYHDTDDKAETLPLTKYSELFKLLIAWVKEI